MTINTKITTPPPTERTWRTLDDVLKVFSPEEVTLMVHRYCDAQDYAKAYRSRKAQGVKAMAEALAAAGIDLKALAANSKAGSK